MIIFTYKLSTWLTSTCRRFTTWFRYWQLSWVNSQDPVGGHVLLLVSWLTTAKCKPYGSLPTDKQNNTICATGSPTINIITLEKNNTIQTTWTSKVPIDTPTMYVYIVVYSYYTLVFIEILRVKYYIYKSDVFKFIFISKKDGRLWLLF